MSTQVATEKRIIPSSPTEERLLEGLQSDIHGFRDATAIYPRRVTHHIYTILNRWHSQGCLERKERWGGSYHGTRSFWRISHDSPALLHDAYVTQARLLDEQRVVVSQQVSRYVDEFPGITPDAIAALSDPIGVVTPHQEITDRIETINQWVRNAHYLRRALVHVAGIDADEQALIRRITDAGLDPDAIMAGVGWGESRSEDPLEGDA